MPWIDWLGTLASGAATLGNFALPGLLWWWCVLPATRERDARIARHVLWLAMLAAIGTLALLACGRASATARPADLLQPALWLAYGLDTRSGQLLLARLSLLLCVAFAALHGKPPGRLRLAFALAGAVGGLLCASFASHAGADDDTRWVVVHGLHLLAGAAWFGGLWLLWLTRDAPTDLHLARLTRFSRWALPLMVATLACGTALGVRYVSPAYASLVATPHGIALSIKLIALGGILAIAAVLRARVVEQPATTEIPRGVHTTRLLAREWWLALLLVLCAAVAGRSVPGNHADIPHWPWPFRFSFAATWPEPGTAPIVAAGTGLLGLGLLALRKSRRAWPLPVAGVCVVLYAFAVPASDETYRFPTVAFDAVSIANGANRFATHCAACHGPQGKGNGPLATRTPVPPIDLLTEPHTARHTVGDFFHWISAGIPGRGMPGFAASLEEDTRWDLVHFLHAITKGYEARVLRPTPIPRAPLPQLGAIDFSWATRDGELGLLHESQRKEAVVLVFTTAGQDDTRLAALSALDWAALEARLLIVPMDGATPPFPQTVVEGAPEITATYRTFRRTVSHPDLLGPGTTPAHLELLIDRFGYLRARWIPAIDGTGWSDPAVLVAAIKGLNAEPEVLPPPSPHAH